MTPTPTPRIIAALLLTALLAFALPSRAEHPHSTAIPGATKSAETDAALRDLWLGHAFWVRNVAAATLDGSPAGATAAEKEVVANARQIATAIEPFYGKAAADKLFGLLAGHYGAVKEYLEATVAASPAKQDQALKTLTANAAEISTFLGGANPHWTASALNGLLLAHGGHHLKQIQQLKAKQYAEEAQTWAAMKDHMYVIADALAGGLAKQFPDKF